MAIPSAESAFAPGVSARRRLAAALRQAPSPMLLLLVLSGLWLLRRLGSTVVMLLAARDPEIPSLRLWPQHRSFVLRWSWWLLL